MSRNLSFSIFDDPVTMPHSDCNCLWGIAHIDPLTGDCTCTGYPYELPPTGGGQDPGPAQIACDEGYYPAVVDGIQVCLPLTPGPLVTDLQPWGPKPNPRGQLGIPIFSGGYPGAAAPPKTATQAATATPATGDGTIFGFSPWVVLAAAAGGVFLLSQMGDETPKGGKTK